MVRAAVVLLFLACASAVPVPGKPKFTLVKDSSLGFGAAAAGSKSSGVVEESQSVEAPLPGDTGDNVPDVTLIDNVNGGAALAVGGSTSVGVLKKKHIKHDTIPF